MINLNEQKLLNTINEKWTNKNCPMCSCNHWQIEKDMVTAVRINQSGGIQLGGNVMPLVAITCINCGNVLFVNPLVVQCLDIEEKEKE